MTERERNRKILKEMHPELLEFMDEMRKEFGDVRVTNIHCEVKEDEHKKQD